nr:DctP family TRAP transporter solute-binding subunit [uncultured Desulfobacter sp.]
MKKIVFMFVCISMILFGALCEVGIAYEMKIAIGNPAKENHFGWTPFVVFKNEVERRSQGRLKVKLYSQTLGASSSDKIETILDGLVDARDSADGHLATIYPPIQVLSIPYLFSEREIVWEVLDGPFGQRLIDDMAQKTGLRPLYWIENGGFRHYSNNKRAIHSPADMKGLRIRTMESPLHMKIVSDLGGRAVPLAWADVSRAIEFGIVDGQENSIGTFMIPHLENIQSHIILDGHVYGTYTLLMSERWYQSLPDDLKTVINHAKLVSAEVNRKLAVANETEGLNYLKAHGVTIYKPSAEQLQLFRQKTQASAIDWLNANVGQEWVQAVLDAVLKAKKKLEYRK